MVTKLPSVTGVLTVFSVIFILASSVLYVPPVSAATIFEDGFESGDFTAWTSTTGSPTVTSSTSHHGTYSACFDAEEYCMKSYVGTSLVYARCYMKWSNSLLSGDFFYVNLIGVAAVSNVFRVLLYNNGADVVWGIVVIENTVFNTYYSTQQKNPSASTWYCVEIMADMSTNNGQTDGNYRIWINGNELTDITRTNIDTDYTYTNVMIAGTQLLSYGGKVYLDCFVVDTGYIGPEDMTAPVFGTETANTTHMGTPCSFDCLINDNANVSTYIFSTNNTGTWQNDTAIAFTNFYNGTAAWANTTKTLNNTVGNVVSYMWYANDTSNNWNHSIQYNLTLTAPQYYLTVVSLYGTTNGQGWYVNGSTAYAILDTGTMDHGNGTRRVFTNWGGDASGTNFAQSNPITMNENKTAIANFKTQYYVSVSSPHGTPNPASGWFDSGASITASVTSPATGPIGTRYVCTGWTGSGSVPSSGTTSTTTFTIMQASSITWNWKTQYLLTVRTDPASLSPQPTRNPTGETGTTDSWWYDATTNVTLTAQEISGYTFNNWDVDATSKGTGVNPITVKMNTPHTATAHYALIPPPAMPVGGDSISLAKSASTYDVQVYAALIGLIGVALILVRRKRK